MAIRLIVRDMRRDLYTAVGNGSLPPRKRTPHFSCVLGRSLDAPLLGECRAGESLQITRQDQQRTPALPGTGSPWLGV